MALPAPSAVLTAVARLVAESRTLRDLVTGLATILREAIPFEQLHILRFDRAESFVLYSADSHGTIDVTARRIGGPGELPDEAVGDARSRLVCTIRQGAAVRGALWLTSTMDEAFTDEHQELADAVSDLLALAFQSATLLERERLRRERIDSLRGLLHTISESLDIRQVFGEISEVVRGGLPHDVLAVTSWAADLA
jgi:GAF domain-containing protein